MKKTRFIFRIEIVFFNSMKKKENQIEGDFGFLIRINAVIGKRKKIKSIKSLQQVFFLSNFHKMNYFLRMEFEMMLLR